MKNQFSNLLFKTVSGRNIGISVKKTGFFIKEILLLICLLIAAVTAATAQCNPCGNANLNTNPNMNGSLGAGVAATGWTIAAATPDLNIPTSTPGDLNTSAGWVWCNIPGGGIPASPNGGGTFQSFFSTEGIEIGLSGLNTSSQYTLCFDIMTTCIDAGFLTANTTAPVDVEFVGSSITSITSPSAVYQWETESIDFTPSATSGNLSLLVGGANAYVAIDNVFIHEICTTGCDGFANTNFDTVTACPDDFSQVNRFPSWDQVTIGGTSDGFCTPASFWNANLGTAPTFATNFLGGFGYYLNGGLGPYAEYVGQCLSTPWLAGETYTISLDFSQTKGSGNHSINILGYVGSSCPTTPVSTGGGFNWDELCGQPNWVVLDSFTETAAPGDSNWTNITATFTVPSNISYVAFGQCSYGGAPGAANNYFIYDNFCLNTTPDSSCTITDAGKTLETCNDNSTPTNSSDDYITFNLNPTGTNLTTTFSLSANNGGVVTLPAGGSATGISYNTATAFRLQNGSADGITSYTITITDDTDGCTSNTMVLQNSCEAALDYGDAPNSYLTLDSSGGAAHIIDGNILLGANIDADNDGFSEGSDDNSDASDDDNQSTVLPTFYANATPVSTGIGGSTNGAEGAADGTTANIGNGDELIVQMSSSLSSGNSFNVYLSGNATGNGEGTIEVCTTGAAGGASCTLAKTITNAETSTAIQAYAVTSPVSGDYVRIIRTANTIRVDAVEGFNTAADDEDGAAFTTIPAASGSTYNLNFTAVNTSGSTVNVAGWIDFDINGTFDADEYASTTVANAGVGGTLSWTLPGDVTAGTSYARLRISGDAISNTTFGGLLTNGEVEDYQVTLAAACALTDAGETLETCNDNGTTANAADDYITFSLNPAGTNLGTTYSVTSNNGGVVTMAAGGSATGISYNTATAFRLQNGSADGTTSYTITITDDNDGSCTTTTNVLQNSCAAGIDRSDAPATYGEAIHTIVSGIYLGAGDPDADSGSLAGANADGDDNDTTDDEDGATLPVSFTPSTTETISVAVAGAGGYLQAWIDWDQSGTFDAGEQVSTNLQDGGGLDTNPTTGIIDFDFAVPAGATLGSSFARFRWSTDSSLDATTAATDGEVEDYPVTINAFTPTQYGDFCSTNILRFVLPADEDISKGLLGWNGPAKTYTNVGGSGLDLVVEIFLLDGVTPSAAAYYLGTNGVLSGERRMRLTFYDTGTTTPAEATEFSITMEDFETNGTSPELLEWMDVTDAMGTTTRVNIQTGTIVTAYSGSPTYANGGETLEGHYPAGGGPQPGKWSRIALPTGNYHQIELYPVSGVGGPAVALCQSTAADYGDAPTTYGGAQHNITASNSLGLGNLPDVEYLSAFQGYPTDATGDNASGINDEDGVTLPATIAPGATESISVSVAGAGGNLQAWIDWDQSGTFETGEQVANNLQDGGALDTNPTTGIIDFDVAVPAGATLGTSFARFRWSTDIGLDATTPASDGEVEDYEVTIGVTNNPFITTWRTTTANEVITMPTRVGVVYNFTINWGDGSLPELITGNDPDPQHTYITPGDYQVLITGDFPHIQVNNSVDQSTNRLKLISVDQWGDIEWDSMLSAFQHAANLVIEATDTPDLSGVTSLQSMFESTSSLVDVSGQMNSWDTSTITNMSRVFAGSVFNDDIGAWDTSSVTTMAATFNNAPNFNQDIGGWDTGNLTDMSNMFNFAALFNQDIGAWDTSSVTTLYATFQNAQVFNQDIGSWNTSNVSNLQNTFYSALDFNQDIGNWDTSNVITMQSTFNRASSFNQDLPWDTGSVTTLHETFRQASVFDGDISGWDTSDVTTMMGTFRTALVFNQDISAWDTSSVTDMTVTFEDARLFNQDIGSWDTGAVTTMFRTFRNSYDFNHDIGAWDTSSVISMRDTFNYALDFNQDIGGWDTSNVTTMFGMFTGAASFNQDIGTWDIGLVADMTSMLNNSGLSAANYDATLIGWEMQATKQSAVPLGSVNLIYCVAESERANLIATNGWVITGDSALCDRSDAPLSYGDVRHRADILGIFLGAGNPDTDLSSIVSANADGDDTDNTDDEDGITLTATFALSVTETISAVVTGAGGNLQAWIDWDQSGTFEAGEQVANNLQDGGALDTNPTTGIIDFDVAVPAGATLGTSFARFRWSTDIGLDATTPATDGEVEDYQVNITAPVCNLNNAGKAVSVCNNNGTEANTADDYITFSLNPAGSNLGATYTVTANNGGVVTLISGGAATNITYGLGNTFRLQNGSADGVTTYTITLTDDSDSGCTITTLVSEAACSVDPCDPVASGNTDTDGDGISDICDLDDDNDGITDIDEGYANSLVSGSVINWLHITEFTGANAFTNTYNQDAYLLTLPITNPTTDVAFWDSGTGVNLNYISGQGAAEINGSGLVSVLNLGQNFLTGVDQTDLAGAQSGSDYVEYQFATAPSFTEDEVYFDSITLLRQSPIPGWTEFNYAILISDDNFLTNTILTQDDLASLDASTVPTAFSIDNNGYALQPATSYQVRIYFYNSADGNSAVIDDFGIRLRTISYSDTNSDTVGDYLELDSDGDGCNDANEAYTSALADGGDTGIYGSDTPTLGNGGVNSNGLVIAAGINATDDAYSTVPAITAGGQKTFQEAITTAVTENPSNISIAAGNSATFTATATADLSPVTNPVTTASTDLSYQWQVSVDGGSTFNNVSGGTGGSGIANTATQISYITPALFIADNANQYHVIFLNEANICEQITAPATLNVTENPLLESVKTASITDTVADGVNGVGDTINYTITVENKGDVVLNGVSISETLLDNNSNPLSLTTGPAYISADMGSSEGNLLVDETATYSATYVLTQSDVDAGGVNNSVTANGNSPSGINASDVSDDNDDGDGNTTDDPTATIIPEAGNIDLTKTATLNEGGDGVANVGDTINYTYTITNNGNVTLSGIDITDPGVLVSGGSLAILVVGGTDTATFTGTYTLTQADIDSGSFSSTATATGTTPAAATVTDDSDDPADLTDIDSDGDGDPEDPTVTLLPEAGNINLTKTGALNDGGDGLADAGDTISYTYTVENNGNVTLTGVNITDPGVTVSGGPLATLAVGTTDTATFTGTYTLTQADIDSGSFSGTATATGTTPAAATVTDDSDDPADLTDIDSDGDGDPEDPTVTLLPEAGNINLTKTSTLNDGGDGVADTGDTISYTYTVENNGNVTLTGIGITDPGVTGSGGPLATLAVGTTDTATFTGTYTLTQADIDSGSFGGTATATGTTPAANIITDDSDDPADLTDIDSDGDGDPEDPTVTLLPEAGNINLTKTATLNDGGDGVADTGDTISYTYTVENNGNVTLTGVSITDPGVTGSGGPLATLAVGTTDTATFTGTYTLTQADIDSGSFSGTATATGTTPAAATVTDDSDDPADLTDIDSDGDGDPEDPTLTLLPEAGNINLTKTSTLNDGGDGVADTGDTISYTYTVENNGNVTLTGISITDPGVSVSGGSLANLVVGGTDTATFTGTYTLTQADIDSGSFGGTATATGTTPAAATVTDDSDDPTDLTDIDSDGDGDPEDPTVTLLPEAGNINLTKTATLNDGGDGVADAGDTISYTYTVENNGNVTLTGVNITDPGVTVSGGPLATLAVGTTDTATFTGTYTLIQADIDSGSFGGTATATGTTPAANIITDDSDDPADLTDIDSDGDSDPEDPTVTLLPEAGNINLTKTATLNDGGDGVADTGDTISYTYTVENNGNVTLTGVSITDPGVTGSGGPLATLAVGTTDTATFTGTYTLTQADIDSGSFSGTATATGTTPAAATVTDDSDDPADLTDIDSDGDGDPEDPTVTLLPEAGNINLTKTSTLNDGGDGVADTGDTISYTYTVENNGNVTLTGIGITDPGVTVSGGPLAALAVGTTDTATFTGTYTLTQADIDSGNFSGTATATGTTPAAATVTDDSDDPADLTDIDSDGDGDPEDPTLTLLPEAGNINLTKTGTLNDGGDGVADAGDTISYTYTVENNGNVTLTGIGITDPGVTVSGGPLAALAVGTTDTATFTGTYTLTQADIDSGNFSSTATATGTTPAAATVTDDSDDPADLTDIDSDGDGDPEDPTVTLLPEAGNINLTKTGTLNDGGDGVADAGDTISYTYTVENNGNVTLTGIGITDPGVTGSGGPLAALAVGTTDTATFTGTYTLTQADIDSGNFSSTATATGTTPAAATVTDDSDDPADLTDIDSDGDGDPEDPTVTLLPEAGNIDLIKTSKLNDGGDGIAQVGETITYNFAVTNNGNVTLTNLILTDPNTFIGGAAIPTLAVGATDTVTFTAAHILTQTDIDAGSYLNLATITGIAPSGAIITDNSDDPLNPTDFDPDGDGDPEDATATIIPENPSLEAVVTGVIADTVPDGINSTGDIITYTISIENIGNVTLNSVTIDDTLIDENGLALNLTSDPSFVNADLGSSEGVLLVGETAIYTANYIVAIADAISGGVSFRGLATGVSPVGTVVNDISDNGDDTDGNTTDDVFVIELIGDSDGDGVNDFDEMNDGTDPLDFCDFIQTSQSIQPTTDWNDADCDGDGVTNANELLDNTDPLNPCGFIIDSITVLQSTKWMNADCDNDGIANGTEIVNIDTDIDGVLDYLDIDDDNDGIISAKEGISDLDEDLIPNYLDLDADNDGIPDNVEAQTTMAYDLPSYEDFDGNGLDDIYEDTPGSGEGILEENSDLDALPDYLDRDSDNDGVSDRFETGMSGSIGTDSDFDGLEDALDADNNGYDRPNGLITIPMVNLLDTDNTEDVDYRDTDDDGDGIPTDYETPDPNNDGNPNDAINSDGDDLPDYLEPNNGEGTQAEAFNAVTPNEDGKNDVFTMRNAELHPENILEIYNRWGVLVYESEVYGKNGNFFKGISEGRNTIKNNQLLPVGTYFYILKYLENGVAKNQSGYMYINR